MTRKDAASAWAADRLEALARDVLLLARAQYLGSDRGDFGPPRWRRHAAADAMIGSIRANGLRT
jgi:hypothetical protein